MRKQKSCEEMSLHIKHPSHCTNMNSNIHVTNLMKSKPCHKMLAAASPDAYDLANTFNQINKYCENISKNVLFNSARKNKSRKTYTQQDMDRLICIQEELKMQALQNICSSAPIKLKKPLRVTTKQLAELNDNNTMKARMKRGEVVKKVMMNTTENKQKAKSTKKKPSSSMSASQNSCSFSGHTFDTFKSSFQQESQEQKTVKVLKMQKFENELAIINYKQVYNKQRRKQAWKAYQDAERNKIIMMKPQNMQRAHITFINDPSNGSKCKRRNAKSLECQEVDQNLKTLAAFKEFNKNFQHFSSNYRLKLK